ncbi:MAG: bifunctional oligoribonuclease/PAP phosphatase NrnA [Nitrospinota bacterium]
MIPEELKKTIKDDDNFLISSHMNPDGDAIGGVLAIGWLLNKLGKRHVIVLNNPPSEKFRYLSEFEKILSYSDDLKIDFNDPNKVWVPRNLIVVDSPNLERLENVKKLLSKDMKIINIDHHESNSFFGDINYVDLKAGASTEMIYDVILSFGIPLDKDVAEYIYTGIVIDTGRFRFSNTTPKSLEISAKLLETGARVSYIAEWLYHTNSAETLKGLGVLLNSLEIGANGRVAFVHFDNTFLKRNDISKIDTEGFVNYPLSIEGVKVAAFLQEHEKGKIRVSLRSKDTINVNEIAKVFGGGGHDKAAGCRINGTISDAKRLLMGEIGKRFN